MILDALKRGTFPEDPLCSCMLENVFLLHSCKLSLSQVTVFFAFLVLGIANENS